MTFLRTASAMVLALVLSGCGEREVPSTTASTALGAHAVIAPEHVELFPRSPALQQQRGAVEFFSYGCGHCQAFAPLIADWAKQQSTPVEYIPVAWNAGTELYARFFYLIRSQSNFDTLHQGMFEQVVAFDRQTPLEQRRDSLIEWLQQQGLSLETIAQGLTSPSAEAAVERAKRLAEHYQIASTPTLVVNGTDKILNQKLTGYPHLLAVATQRLSPPDK